MAGSLIAGALGAAGSIIGGMTQADAARDAARQQQKAIDRGIKESQPFYEDTQNFLSPFISAGKDSLSLIQDIQGVNGPEAQARALQMYQSNPSATLLDDVNAEAVRKTIGAHAAAGSANSGSATTDLARRLSDIRLGDYYNWQNLGTNLANTGANMANSAANYSNDRGNTILGARTGQGTAAASGTIGAANAQVGGLSGATNWLAYALGNNSGNNFSNMFGSGTNAPSGSLPWQANYSPAKAMLSGNMNLT